MSVELKVPQLGESITEAVVGKWHKKPGDAVAADEPVVVLETDKVTVDVQSPAAGALSSIAFPEGAKVKIGDVLGTINPGEAGKKAVGAQAVGVQTPAPVPAAARFDEHDEAGGSGGRHALDRQALGPRVELVVGAVRVHGHERDLAVSAVRASQPRGIDHAAVGEHDRVRVVREIEGQPAQARAVHLARPEARVRQQSGFVALPGNLPHERELRPRFGARRREGVDGGQIDRMACASGSARDLPRGLRAVRARLEHAPGIGGRGPSGEEDRLPVEGHLRIGGAVEARGEHAQAAARRHEHEPASVAERRGPRPGSVVA